MDDLQFYLLLNSILVISGQWVGDNERLCAVKPPKNPIFKWGFNLGLLDQQANA